MEPAEKHPWYKQFWPWFLILLPITSMVLSFNMLRLAIQTEDSLVIDDYYKEGKAINVNLHKIEQARQLGIETNIQFSDDEVVMNIVNGNIEDGSALTLDFYHSTQSYKDFSVVLLKDASGAFRANVEQAIAGKWQISLHPHDESWKIQQVVILPQKNAVLFKP